MCVPFATKSNILAPMVYMGHVLIRCEEFIINMKCLRSHYCDLLFQVIFQIELNWVRGGQWNLVLNRQIVKYIVHKDRSYIVNVLSSRNSSWNVKYIWNVRLVILYTNPLTRKQGILIGILILFRFICCLLDSGKTLLLIGKLETGAILSVLHFPIASSVLGVTGNLLGMYNHLTW